MWESLQERLPDLNDSQLIKRPCSDVVAQISLYMMDWLIRNLEVLIITGFPRQSCAGKRLREPEARWCTLSHLN